MVDPPVSQHRCSGHCDCDPDSFANHDIPTLHRIADLYLGDVRLLVSHVIDLSSRAAQLDPAHRGVRAMCAAARQIAAITAERQLKLGELLDEVVRRKAPASVTPPPRLPPIATSSAPLLDLPLTADEPPAPLPSSFPLLALPGEIRNLIYAFCLTPTSGSPVIRPYSDRRRSAAGGVTPALLATSRQVHAEATPILYGANTLELDVFKVPRFMFQIAGSSRWLRRVRVTGLAELKVLGAGRVVEADEADGCSRERRRSGGGGALRRIVSARIVGLLH